MQDEGRNLGFISLGCGIASLITSCCCLGLILGIIGLVCGIMARRNGNRETLCMIGMVFSGIGIAIYLFFTIVGAILMTTPVMKEFMSNPEAFQKSLGSY